MRFNDLILETKPRPIPKVLYHGTIKRYIPLIKSEGLQPRVGKYVKSWFGDSAPPLVFADDRRHILNCLIAIFAQAEWREEPTREQFFQEAALVVISGESFSHKSHAGSHPISVDGNTYYSTKPVKPIKILIDEALGDFIGPLWADAKWEWFHG